MLLGFVDLEIFKSMCFFCWEIFFRNYSKPS
jgi:hypothetical protein